MNNDTDDDLPAELTALLRNVDGVHTVYATQSLVTTVVGAVVEAVRNDKVGMHMVGVYTRDGRTEVETCIGVFPDEPASVVCRRAHDALRSFFLDSGREAPAAIEVRIGRVG